MNYREKKIKEFQEKFIYDFFDETGLEILGNKEANRPATMDELEAFLSETIEECRDDFIMEMEVYRDGFIRDDGFGDMERAAEYQVIQDLIDAVNNKFNGKEEGC